MRAVLRRPVLLLLLLPLVLAGCGGSAARSAVSDAQKSLATLTRATLHLKLALHATTRTTGFQLDGAFSIAPGEAPLADAVYQRAGDRSVHVLLDRTHGSIRIGSAPPDPLSPAQLTELAAAISPRSTHGVATYVQAGKWVTHPQLAHLGAFDRVTGGLALSRVARDLLAIAAASGYAVPALSADDLGGLDRLVASSSFELTEMHDTHVLRRLAIRFALKPEARDDPLGRRFGTSGTLVLALDRVGEPVRIPAS